MNAVIPNITDVQQAITAEAVLNSCHPLLYVRRWPDGVWGVRRKADILQSARRVARGRAFNRESSGTRNERRGCATVGIRVSAQRGRRVQIVVVARVPAGRLRKTVVRPLSVVVRYEKDPIPTAKH